MKCIAGKYLARILFSLLLAGTASAANLCDVSCELSVTFPDGGSIEAVKDLTIQFGDGGYINNGTVITGYSAGDIVALSAGDSIAFQANGEFVLGKGNIDYSDILIISNGVMQLAAVDGEAKVSIYDMTLLGGASLAISSDFEVVDTGSFHIFTGPVTASSDLVFVNNGSVSGLFVFDNATMSIDDETYDVSGAVLIEADRLLEMTSSIPSVPTPSTTATTEIVMATKTVVEDDATQEPGSSGDTSVTASASEGSSGMINLLTLFIVFILLSCRRFHGAGRV